MRVLHLIHSEGIYGAELILVYLAREMQRLGHEMIVGSIQDPGTLQTAFERFALDCGLDVQPVRIHPRPTPDVVRSLLRIVRTTGANLIHSHGYKADILLGLLPRRIRGPMLTTAHGWTYPPRFTALWLYQMVDRWCLRRLDKVIVVAPHMLGIDAVRNLAPGKTAVICNGIPALPQRLADQQARAVQAIPASLKRCIESRPTLVAIGRLSAEKGFDVLLDAFGAACRDNPAWQLAIIGEGSERTALLQRASKLGIAGHVLMPGYVDCADRVLESAKGFVMSSFTEGLPLALLEAMQWRAPIVATSVGAIPEVLDQGACGLLVQPGNVESLADGLKCVMSQDESVTAMTQRAYERVTGQYSSTRMAEHYAQLYGELSGL